MKKYILSALAVCVCASALAQAPRAASPLADANFQFTTVKANPITSVKNQASSSTCWAYSTISFLESEAIRLNNIKDEAKYPDFSEFFVVSHSYAERAAKYVYVDGALGFSAGSEADDVLHVVRDHGIVSNEAMTGMNYGSALPRQAEMDAALLGYISAVANASGTRTTAWKRGVQAILDEYLGECPASFVVDGKTYTPESYRDAMKINPDDYVTMTSFTHHPFYTKFPLEVADNWRWDSMYNLPIDEFIECLDNAIMNGYTAAWGADVSNTGFGRTGVAMYITATAPTTGSDQAHWVGADPTAPKPVAKVVEGVPSQEQRQIEFENKTLTDDHGMHIFGIAKDQNGNKFYMVKNSWGDSGKYHGIYYVSEAYVKAQSLDIMIHKTAVPKAIAKKLGL